MLKLQDFEIFNFADNHYTPWTAPDGKQWLVNRHPYLSLVLTDHCNANCKFCAARLIHCKRTADLLVFKEKIKFAVEQLGVEEILFLGGEPTISPILFELAGYCRSLPAVKKMILTTNGIRMSQDQDFTQAIIAGHFFDHINFSIMNPDAGKRSYIAGRQDVPVFSIADFFCMLNSLKMVYQSKTKFRVNVNVFKGNMDSAFEIFDYWGTIRKCVDSMKFSPLLPTDQFSAQPDVSDWVRQAILSQLEIEAIFGQLVYMFDRMAIATFDSRDHFGFVRNSIICATTPIILNWNVGDYSNMMNKVVHEHKINNVKLLPTGDLSLSWNRELPEYFIPTE